MYTIHRKQQIPITLKEAWNFFADPTNLKTITPDYMGFEIVSGGDKKMYPGQIIEYVVTPLAGIKTQWVTEITHVAENQYFVDEQRIGPYKLWHHQHRFKSIPNGTEIEDTVDYELPAKFIGQLVHKIIVKQKLHEIFSYRKKKLESLLGKY